jgi:ATP-dependent 26S proteasome regulatory subunit
MSLAEYQLSPTQRRALDSLYRALPVGNVFVVHGETGAGKTTLLREIQRKHGGVMLSIGEFIESLAMRSPTAIEETFQRFVADALAKHEFVLIDDLHMLMSVVCSHGCNPYPRAGFLELPLKTLATVAEAAGRRLIIAHDSTTYSVIRDRCFYAAIEQFTAEDYQFFCQCFLGFDNALALNFKKIHRFAPRLNAHQLKTACSWLGKEAHLDTNSFIDYLRSQRMASNVDLAEVQPVNLHDLKGVDDVLEALEANVILPLEDDQLASEMNIKPKRGVLLAGPPGTGKTTIGRALAHRLKGKFFLIDGTFIAGTGAFYQQVHHVFEAAKHNAPAVIFIDDSDVIFQDGEETGLYRYLLTMLDGLESASAGRVCVMMTAMDLGALPPALVRSGRIELWLQTRLPDADGREAILREVLSDLTAVMGEADASTIAAATDGMTGADLKRLVEDAKLLFAFDRRRGRDPRAATEYLLRSAQMVRENKQRYAAAEAEARQRRPSRPVWYDVASAIASSAMGAGVPKLGQSFIGEAQINISDSE